MVYVLSRAKMCLCGHYSSSSSPPHFGLSPSLGLSFIFNFLSLYPSTSAIVLLVFHPCQGSPSSFITFHPP
jgi:hypothetical protein